MPANLEKITPLILSGGAGSRLWPVSRSSMPKQLLALGSIQSMIAETATRVGGDGFAAPIVVCNKDHVFLIFDQLTKAGIEPQKMVAEPVGRNTAGAIAAGLLASSSIDDASLILVLPSDHVIGDSNTFLDAIASGAIAARAGHIVAFGVVPERPETGYGYIEHGGAISGAPAALSISRFVEKPDLETATSYMAAGNYSWNAGIFLFSARTIIEAFQLHSPAIFSSVQNAIDGGNVENITVDLGGVYAEVPAEPFDIAIMEKTDRGAVVPVSMGWSDIGSWHSYWTMMPKDEAGNVTIGDATLIECSNSLIWSGGDTVTAAVGVSDLIVIVTDDAVLVLDQGRSEHVKEIVDKFQSEGRNIQAVGSTVFRPWGNYRTLDTGPGFLVKRIVVNPGASLSLQYHHHRAEHWTVAAGEAKVTVGERVFNLEKNGSTDIAIGEVHRLENTGTEPLHLIEVQTGDILREDDIVRLEDRYGRIEGKDKNEN